MQLFGCTGKSKSRGWFIPAPAQIKKIGATGFEPADLSAPSRGALTKLRHTPGTEKIIIPETGKKKANRKKYSSEKHTEKRKKDPQISAGPFSKKTGSPFPATLSVGTVWENSPRFLPFQHSIHRADHKNIVATISAMAIGRAIHAGLYEARDNVGGRKGHNRRREPHNGSWGRHMVLHVPHWGSGGCHDSVVSGDWRTVVTRRQLLPCRQRSKMIMRSGLLFSKYSKNKRSGSGIPKVPQEGSRREKPEKQPHNENDRRGGKFKRETGAGTPNPPSPHRDICAEGCPSIAFSGPMRRTGIIIAGDHGT